MATPQSTASYEDSGSKKLEQITFRFCSECSNMLYPKEDEEAHKLQFTCRTCQYTEEAQSTCVFRNVLNNSAGETAGVTQDVGSDPTVSHDLSVTCSNCVCSVFCTSCGKFLLDVTAPERLSETEKGSGGKEVTSLSQYFSWSDYDDPYAEYDEELMDEVDDDLCGLTSDSFTYVASSETNFSNDGVKAFTK